MDVEPHASDRPASHASPSNRWPGRSRRLIERCRALGRDWLVQLLRACTAEFDRQLFTLSDHARDPFEQQRHFAVRQRLTQARASLEKNFFEQLDAGFERIGLDDEPPAQQSPLPLPDRPIRLKRPVRE